MPIPKPPLDKLQRCADEIAIACGNLSQAAVALGVTRSTAQHWRKLCAEYGIEPKVKAQTPEQMRARIQVLERDLAALKAQPPSPEYKLPPVKDRPKDRPNRDAAQVRRHFYIPDTQVRPGVPLDHIGWVAQALVDYAPDEICHLGDHWDFPSLNSHVQPGAAPLEGARYQDDLEAGNAAFARLCAPMEAQLALKGNKWKPRKRFLAGNHEDRADRVATNDPRWMGHVGSNNCQVRDWEWVPFLKRSNADGIMASHYFASQHSKFPVGGEVSNRLNKIGQSFIQGHEQGFRYGNKVLGNGQTIHGIVAGSCYLHIEDYRGRQNQRHWRGIVVLNEVENGDLCIMPLSLKYLCRKYEGVDLYAYMSKKYPDGDWEHLI